MSKPTLAVHKFSSCDGCQLSILNLEDELLANGKDQEVYPAGLSSKGSVPFTTQALMVISLYTFETPFQRLFQKTNFYHVASRCVLKKAS